MPEGQQVELYTVSEAAAYIGVSRPTVYGLLKQLQPVAKKGRIRLFSRTQLDAVKESRK